MKNDKTLADHVGQILLPTEKYAQLRNGKRVVKEKLFLPGYVLVEAQLDNEITHTLRYIPIKTPPSGYRALRPSFSSTNATISTAYFIPTTSING